MTSPSEAQATPPRHSGNEDLDTETLDAGLLELP